MVLRTLYPLLYEQLWELKLNILYFMLILKYSKSFEEHLIHLNTVIGKLARAGFTLNIDKCHFCREVKFLGYIIDITGVSADPERVEAILRYPAPRNCKQLRHFLGICNFHSRCERWDGVMWTGLVWLRIGTGGGELL
jgi:hypothetical protein